MAVVTYLLIAACVGVFVDQTFLHQIPERYLAVSAHAPWQAWIGNIFAHAGFFHLAINMTSMMLIVEPTERVIGHARTLVAYLLCGLAGSLLFVNLSSGSVVGASGAIFGIFGVSIVISIVLTRSLSLFIGNLIMIAINAAYGFLVPGIAWQSHLGGLVLGVVFGVIFSAQLVAEQRRQQRREATPQPQHE